MAITVKGENCLSDDFRQEILKSGEEIIEPGPDNERVTEIMASYFEILEKLEQAGVVISSQPQVTEFDILSAIQILGTRVDKLQMSVNALTSAITGHSAIYELANSLARERAQGEKEKIKKARLENSKK